MQLGILSSTTSVTFTTSLSQRHCLMKMSPLLRRLQQLKLLQRPATADFAPGKPGGHKFEQVTYTIC